MVEIDSMRMFAWNTTFLTSLYLKGAIGMIDGRLPAANGVAFNPTNRKSLMDGASVGAMVDSSNCFGYLTPRRIMLIHR
jgi:hypothetical protein